MSAADPPGVTQKTGNKRKLENASGKWDLGKANLHMYNFVMVQEFLAGKLDLHTDVLCRRSATAATVLPSYTCFAWAGGNFFPVVLLCQFFVLAGNRFWFYILLCT